MEDTHGDRSWTELFFGTAFLAAGSSSSANPAAQGLAYFGTKLL